MTTRCQVIYVILVEDSEESFYGTWRVTNEKCKDVV